MTFCARGSLAMSSKDAPRPQKSRTARIASDDGSGHSSDENLSDGISASAPMWLDAGYRLGPRLYLGVYIQYAIVIVRDDAGPIPCYGACSQQQVGTRQLSGAASDVRFGIEARYHLVPRARLDPWVGLRFGYEVLYGRQSASGSLAGSPFSTELRWQYRGFEFASLQIRGEWEIAPGVAVGPFANVSLAQFDTCSAGGSSSSPDIIVETPAGESIRETALHGWWMLGVGGGFDL